MWIVQLCLYFIKLLKKMLNIIIYFLYKSIIHFAVFFVLIIWPFPLLNGRCVQNGKQWARLLKYVTMLYQIKWDIRNSAVLAKDRGAVIVANHQSTLDILGIYNIWEIIDKLSIVAKKELLYSGQWGVLMYFGGLLFVDRKNPKAAYKELEAANSMIREKIKIWVFPEGTRNYDYTKFLPFKKGAFRVAITAQAPIIPLVFSPFYFIDRKKYKYSKGRVIIQCLEEIPTVGLTMDDVPELMDKVRNIMLAAYKELSDEVLTNTSKLGDIKENNMKDNIKNLTI